MKQNYIKLILIFLLILSVMLAFVSCEIAKDVLGPDNESEGPTADGGGDQIIEWQDGLVVTIDGSNSTDPGGGTLTYKWELIQRPFGSILELGEFDTQPIAYFKPDVLGIYIVRLTVRNENYQKDSVDVRITIIEQSTNKSPVPIITYSPLSPVEGELITFSGVSSYDPDGTIVNYSWYIGGITLTGDHVTYIFNTKGDYNITLTVTDDKNDSQSTTITISIAIQNNPPVAVASADDYTPTIGQTITFTSNGSYDPDGDTITYLWDFGDNSTSNLEKVDHTYNTEGVYYVTLTVTDSYGLSDSTSIKITVGNPTNNPPIADAGSDQTGLIFEEILFDGSGSTDPEGDALTYNWSFGDGESASGKVVSHRYTKEGEYKVVLTVKDTANNQSQDAVIATVKIKPVSALIVTAGNLGGIGPFIESLAISKSISSLKSYDATKSIPALDPGEHQVVIVASYSGWADSEKMGYSLAKYISNGGKVILLGASLWTYRGTSQSYTLAGDILDPKFSPFALGDYTKDPYTDLDLPNHLIFSGVYKITTGTYGKNDIQGEATPLGYFIYKGSQAGSLGALNNNLPVAAYNVMPYSGIWEPKTDDFILLIENTILWLVANY